MRERILRGDYALGQVISRRRIAADLGVSFLPASEALLRLECEGLLESRPRAGTRIRIPNRLDVEGHFVVREALEVQAAMIFSQLAAADEREQLLRVARRLDASAAKLSGDPAAYLALHEKFHQTIVDCTRCVALAQALRRQSALGATWLTIMRPGHEPVPCGRHDSLMKALSRHKPAVAAEAMRIHMRADKECTLRLLEPFFESNKRLVQTYSRTLARKPEDSDFPDFELPIPPNTRATHSPAVSPR